MVDKNSTASKIKRHRELRRMSQIKLNQEARFSPGYVSKLESGYIRNPRIVTLKRISSVLGCSLDDLGPSETDLSTMEDISQLAGKDPESNSSLSKSTGTPAFITDAAAEWKAVVDDLSIIARLDPERLTCLGSIIADVKKQVQLRYTHGQDSRKEITSDAS